MSYPLGTGMTRRQLAQVFREHDLKECLETGRVARCRVCTALNGQMIDAIREIMGQEPMYGSGQGEGNRPSDIERFACFGSADVAGFQTMESGCGHSGLRLRARRT